MNDRHPQSVGRRARHLFAGASIVDRLHVLGRWWSCPFPAVEAFVPRQGSVLDVGCGFGLFSAYVALMSSERRVLGIDVDERKIDIARQAATRVDADGVHVAFDVTGSELPQGPFDAIILVDVLYLLGPEAGRQLLERAIGRLAPGGVLLVKEIDRHPAWKYRLSRAQELVATRVLRITVGDEVHFAPPNHYADVLRRGGLTVSMRHLDKGSIHPHHLIVGHGP